LYVLRARNAKKSKGAEKFQVTKCNFWK